MANIPCSFPDVVWALLEEVAIKSSGVDSTEVDDGDGDDAGTVAVTVIDGRVVIMVVYVVASDTGSVLVLKVSNILSTIQRYTYQLFSHSSLALSLSLSLSLRLLSLGHSVTL